MPELYAGGIEQAQIKIIEERNWVDRLIDAVQDPGFAVLLLVGLGLVAFIVYMWRKK